MWLKGSLAEKKLCPLNQYEENLQQHAIVVMRASNILTVSAGVSQFTELILHSSRHLLWQHVWLCLVLGSFKKDTYLNRLNIAKGLHNGQRLGICFMMIGGKKTSNYQYLRPSTLKRIPLLQDHSWSKRILSHQLESRFHISLMVSFTRLSSSWWVVLSLKFCSLWLTEQNVLCVENHTCHTTPNWIRCMLLWGLLPTSWV